MLLVIGICYILYKCIQAAVSDAEMRNWAKSKGYDSYPSQTGLRDTKTNMHCYTDIQTSKKTMWK